MRAGALFLLLCSPFVLRAGTISNFAATSDNDWSDPANWDNGVPNTTSFTADIGIKSIYGAQSAYLDTSEIIGGLSVGGTSSLGFASAANLTLGDSSTVGTLNNAGTVTLNFNTLTLNSSAGTTGTVYNSINSGTLDLYHGTLLINDGGNGVGTSLSGGGTIALDYGTIAGQFGDEQLAVRGTIQGTGTISNLTLEPVSGKTLTLDESGGFIGPFLTIDANATLTTTGGSLVLLGSNLNLSVDNQGTINIGAGDTFTFKGDGTAFGQFALGNDGAINITNGTLKLDSNGGASSAFLIGGVSSTGTLTLSGGTITGTTGTTYFSNYTGSTLQGNGTIASNLSFANVGDVVANGGKLVLGNSLDYNAGTQTLSTFDDQGTFTANNGAILQFDNMAAGTGIVTNATNIVLNGTGEFENKAGHNALAAFLTTNSGSLTLQNGASLSLTQSFTNSGDLNVLAGSKLDLTSGGFANVVGGSLNGGTYTIGGTLKYNGADIAAIGSTTNLTLDGSGVIRNANGGDHDALTGSLATNNGTLTLQSGATLSLTQAFTNNGDLNVLAGSKLDLTSGGFANVVGGSLNGGAYTIGGTLVYNGADITAIGSTTNLTLDASGIIRNTNGGDHNALTHSLATNNGTLTLENGADLTLTQAFTNNGTLNVMAGSTLDLTAGGIANLVGGSLNGGTYTIGGELIYKGDNIKSIGSTASLTLDGSGGSIVNARGGDHDALAGTLATNNGTLILENGADLALTHEFTNRGNLQVLAGSTLDLTGGFGNVSESGVLHGGTYTIGGTLDYSGQDITTIGHTASLTLNGGGVVVNTTGSNPDALSDSLAKNNGTLTLENNATLTLSQNFTNHGTLNVLANSNLQLNGEFTNVSGSGVLKGGNYNIAGTLYYSGADIVTLGTHTSLTLNGTGQAIVDTSDFSSILGTLSRNNGTLTLMNGANLQPPGTFTNHGSAMVLSGSGIVAGSIINSGSLTIAGSFLLGDLQIWSGVESGNGFTNTGNVLIESGTSLTVDTGNYTQQTVGSTEIDGTLNGSVDLGGGTLDGTGTINGTVLNEGGTVTPGDAPGILTVTNFTQTSGDLLFNIEGTIPGVDYSQLLVTNAATFGGNIEFDFANSFVPQSNQVYTLIVFGSSTGSEFGSYTIDNLPAGYTADITYGANDVDVSFVSATPEPASMALMLAGLGAIVFARRRVRR